MMGDVKTKPRTAEYVVFEKALGDVLKVSHAELKNRIEADKKQRAASRPSASRKRASARASDEKD
jgi:hypothetical protein